MFICNNCKLFHLWWKENLVKHQKFSKYEMIVDLTLTCDFFKSYFWKVFHLTKYNFIKQDVIDGVQYRFKDR